MPIMTPGADPATAQSVQPGAPPRPLAQEGLQAKARLQVVLARKVLESVLPILGSESEEGKAVTKALTALAAIASAQDPTLQESEAASLRQVASPSGVGAPRRPQSALGMPSPALVGGMG